MTPPKRTLLGRNNGAMSREAVYETADAIEIESREGYEVNRKRVLFEEVLLVTIHRQLGTGYFVGMLLMTLFIGSTAIVLQFGAHLPVAALIVAILALPFLIACAVRLILKLDFVTVFGRRSKAVMRFPIRKRRAREVYGRICSRTLEVQRAMVATEPTIPATSPIETGPPSLERQENEDLPSA
ncbi:MAG: hypothetical protein QOE82_3214 [Thermoanaerobaculia bacterium]|jgi:hypothetical protein|nr:hypothetical protein [Thermoanaerobaculia bacterium]